ncbi:hypothetical protein [Fusobacterium mortiferum]|uniref:hypothetical protein n=1 Tax=Fusobacterium mortiferum TaxID=850 RepID=UPI003F90B8C1
MKKLIMGLFLTLSIMAVAGEKYDYVEDRLELKYTTLTDSKKNSLKIDDIDMRVFNNHIYVNMEVEAFSGDGGWGKFDKTSYDEIAKTIADDVRKMLNVNDKVEITLLLEREIGKDMMLHNGLY